MEEAEYCDRVVILDAGRVLAQGTPAEIRRRARPEAGREPTMEDAFIAIVEEARDGESPHAADVGGASMNATEPIPVSARFPPRCGGSGRWCARRPGRSSAIPAASPSASCCR